MPVLLDLLLALPVAPLPLLLLQPLLLHALLLEPQPRVQRLFPLLFLAQFLLFLWGRGRDGTVSLARGTSRTQHPKPLP